MNQPRLERKYIFKTTQLKDLVEAIKSHPMFINEKYDERIVNNIYFDTPGLSNFLEGVEGVPERCKVRIRWYNNNAENSYLEVKSKKGSVGDKLRYRLEDFDPKSPNIGKEFYKALNNSDIPQHIKIELKKLIPSSFNSYKRKYFENQKHDLRITLDYDMVFQRMLSEKLIPIKNPKDKTIIMEVKYSSENEKELNELLKYFPLRISKFSKYNQGIVSI